MGVAVFQWKGFPGSSAGKESAYKAGAPVVIPGSGRSPEEGIGCPLQYSWASLLTQTVSNLLAMWEVWVQTLGMEDHLKKGMTVNSSILTWRIQWTEEPIGLRSWGHKELDRTEQLTLSFLLLTEWKQEKFWWNSHMNHEREAIIPLLERECFRLTKVARQGAPDSPSSHRFTE